MSSVDNNNDDNNYIEVLDEKNFEIQHPYIAAIITYMQTQSKIKDRPKRVDLNPAEIQPLLPYLAILEVKYEGDEFADLGIRLIGTELATLYGEVTDTLMSEHPNEFVKKRILKIAKLATESKQTVVSYAERFDEVKNFLKIRSVMIPLFDDDENPDKVTKIIGLVVF